MLEAVESTELDALVRVCAKAGGQAALAGRLNVTPPTVNQWMKKKRPIPDAAAAEMERLYGADVATCEELCPSIRWVRITDPSWPHPDGRPAVDVTSDPTTENGNA